MFDQLRFLRPLDPDQTSKNQSISHNQTCFQLDLILTIGFRLNGRIMISWYLFSSFNQRTHHCLDTIIDLGSLLEPPHTPPLKLPLEAPCTAIIGITVDIITGTIIETPIAITRCFVIAIFFLSIAHPIVKPIPPSLRLSTLKALSNPSRTAITSLESLLLLLPWATDRLEWSELRSLDLCIATIFVAPWASPDIVGWSPANLLAIAGENHKWSMRLRHGP